MSVIKSERKVSEMEFLANARKLQIYTIKKCANFPKRYNFYISTPLAAISTRIHEHVKIGNSIYPTNESEYQLRREQFIMANAELQNLISQIEVASEIFGIEAKTMEYWMSIVKKEIALIKSVIRKDKERLKDIKQ